MHDLHWTEALIAEDACGESWARFARAVAGHEVRAVALGERSRPRKTQRADHLVAHRVLVGWRPGSAQ